MLRTRTTNAETDINFFEDQFEEQREQYDRAIQEYDHNTVDTTEQNNALRNDILNLNSQITELATLIRKYEEDLSGYQPKLDDFEAQLRTIETDLATLIAAEEMAVTEAEHQWQAMITEVKSIEVLGQSVDFTEATFNQLSADITESLSLLEERQRQLTETVTVNANNQQLQRTLELISAMPTLAEIQGLDTQLSATDTTLTARSAEITAAIDTKMNQRDVAISALQSNINAAEVRRADEFKKIAHHASNHHHFFKDKKSVIFCARTHKAYGHVRFEEMGHISETQGPRAKYIP